MSELKSKIAGGADFATLARDFSDGNEAGKGGDKGWVADGLIDDRLLGAIFAAPVGGLSEVVDITNGGEFLFKVLAERTQKPDADAGRHDQGPGVPELVRREEGRGDRHPSAAHRTRDRLTRRPCSTRSSRKRASAGASTSPPASRSSRPSA